MEKIVTKYRTLREEIMETRKNTIEQNRMGISLKDKNEIDEAYNYISNSLLMYASIELPLQEKVFLSSFLQAKVLAERLKREGLSVKIGPSGDTTHLFSVEASVLDDEKKLIR